MNDASHERERARPTEASFPKFPKLPLQIQDMIWEAAIFDPSLSPAKRAPGIHFLNFFDTSISASWEESRHVTYPCGWGHVDVGIPPLARNDSAYRINFAIECTSHGARAALHRHNRLNPSIQKQTLPFEVPMESIQWDQTRDLICLRPIADPRTPDKPLPRILDDYLLHYLPFLRPPHPRAGYDSITALALEYSSPTPDLQTGKHNILWPHIVDGNLFPDTFGAVAEYVDGLLKALQYTKDIFIIDYRIKPRPGLTIADLGRPAFTGHRGAYFLADVDGGNFDLPAVGRIAAGLLLPLGRIRSLEDNMNMMAADEVDVDFRDLYTLILRALHLSGRFAASQNPVRILACVMPGLES